MVISNRISVRRYPIIKCRKELMLIAVNDLKARVFNLIICRGIDKQSVLQILLHFSKLKVALVCWFVFQP